MGTNSYSANRIDNRSDATYLFDIQKDKTMIFCLEPSKENIIDPRGRPIDNIAILTIG